jgi:hypothetical protein
LRPPGTRSRRSILAGRIVVEPTIASSAVSPLVSGLADLGDHRLVVVERGRGVIDRSWPRDPATRRSRPWLGDPAR